MREANKTAATQPQATVPDYTATIIGVGIAVIIAVAVVGIGLFLALRKR